MGIVLDHVIPQQSSTADQLGVGLRESLSIYAGVSVDLFLCKS